MKLRAFYLYLAALLFAAPLWAQENSCALKAEDLKHFGCDLEQTSFECRKWFIDNPELIEFAKDCAIEESDDSSLAFEFAKTCAYAIGESWAEMWVMIFSSAKQNLQYYANCDHEQSLKCKKELAKAGNFAPELRLRAESDPQKYGAAYEEALRDVGSVQLLKKRSQVQELAQRDPKYKAEMIKNNVTFGEKPDVPADMVWDMANQALDNFGVKRRCYNNKGYLKMACAALASTFLDPSILAGGIGGIAIKGGKFLKVVPKPPATEAVKVAETAPAKSAKIPFSEQHFNNREKALEFAQRIRTSSEIPPLAPFGPKPRPVKHGVSAIINPDTYTVIEFPSHWDFSKPHAMSLDERIKLADAIENKKAYIHPDVPRAHAIARSQAIRERAKFVHAKEINSFPFSDFGYTETWKYAGYVRFVNPKTKEYIQLSNDVFKPENQGQRKFGTWGRKLSEKQSDQLIEALEKGGTFSDESVPPRLAEKIDGPEKKIVENLEEKHDIDVRSGGHSEDSGGTAYGHRSIGIAPDTSPEGLLPIVSHEATHITSAKHIVEGRTNLPNVARNISFPADNSLPKLYRKGHRADEVEALLREIGALKKPKPPKEIRIEELRRAIKDAQKVRDVVATARKFIASQRRAIKKYFKDPKIENENFTYPTDHLEFESDAERTAYTKQVLERRLQDLKKFEKSLEKHDQWAIKRAEEAANEESAQKTAP